ERGAGRGRRPADVGERRERLPAGVGGRGRGRRGGDRRRRGRGVVAHHGRLLAGDRGRGRSLVHRDVVGVVGHVVGRGALVGALDGVGARAHARRRVVNRAGADAVGGVHATVERAAGGRQRPGAGLDREVSFAERIAVLP